MKAKSTTAERPRASAEPWRLTVICAIAWLIPGAGHLLLGRRQKGLVFFVALPAMFAIGLWLQGRLFPRSEEHTSELQSRLHLVCRLLLEKKNIYQSDIT